VVIYYATRSAIYENTALREQRRQLFKQRNWRRYKELIVQDERAKQERYARFVAKMLQAVGEREQVFAQSLQMVPKEELLER
jgi:hypothetical protein